METNISLALSTGTSAVLGLEKSRCQVFPSIGYAMFGEGCSNACLYCAQALSSRKGAGERETFRLGRVIWKRYPLELVLEALGITSGGISRLEGLCIQVTCCSGNKEMEKLVQLAGILSSKLVLRVSATLATLDEYRLLASAGVRYFGIPLDVMSRRYYSDYRGGDYALQKELILRVAEEFPGRVVTHLIAGLDESLEEALDTISFFEEAGVGTALFAFTPVRETAFEKKSRPDIHYYRTLQLARWLIREKYIKRSELIYRNGCITCSFLSKKDIETLVFKSGGQAFMTSGCLDCNRPFYNESPGGPLYNYPRPPEKSEIQEALEEALLSWR